MKEEVLEQVAEQETVVETPAENVQEQVETAPENVQEEPVVETPEVEQEVDNEVDNEVEQVSEQPTSQVDEEPVAEPEPEPIRVYTKGKWADLELLTEKEMEVGKTYHIKVSGHCQFAVSAEQPTAGITTNEITFTKQDGLKLWIKTGK